MSLEGLHVEFRVDLSHALASVQGFKEAMERVTAAMQPSIEEWRRAMGLPTSEQLAMQRRIDRHMVRCAARRERRRKGYRNRG